MNGSECKALLREDPSPARNIEVVPVAVATKRPKVVGESWVISSRAGAAQVVWFKVHGARDKV